VGPHPSLIGPVLPIERECSSSLKVRYGFQVGNRAVVSNIDRP